VPDVPDLTIGLDDAPGCIERGRLREHSLDDVRQVAVRLARGNQAESGMDEELKLRRLLPAGGTIFPLAAMPRIIVREPVRAWPFGYGLSLNQTNTNPRGSSHSKGPVTKPGTRILNP
jgi:hypothetical protein